MEPAQDQPQRLELDKGFVLLHQFRMPTLVCSLQDLRPGGCQCVAPRSGLDVETVQAWREILACGLVLGIEITSGARLNHFQVNARIAELRNELDRIDLQFEFINLLPHQSGILGLAAAELHPENAPPPAAGAASPPSGIQNMPADMPPAHVSKRGGTMMRKRFEELPASKLETKAGLDGKEALTAPPPPPPGNYRGLRLGAILVMTGKLTEDQVNTAERRSRSAKEFLGQHLIRAGLLTPIEVCRALSLQSALPVVELPEVPALAKTRFPFFMMLKYEFVPYFESPEMLCVAAKHPFSPQRQEEIGKYCGKRVEVFLAPDHQVARILDLLSPERQKQVRKSVRHKADLPFSFQFCDDAASPDGPMFEGRTLDLSETGFKIEAPRPAWDYFTEHPEATKHVRFILSLAPHHVQGLCRVCHLKRKDSPARGGMYCAAGLEITGINTMARIGLQQICMRIALDNARDKLK